MKTPSFLKNAVYSWAIFFGTVVLLSAGYATYTALSEVDTGDSLTKDIWNQMVGNIAELNTQINGISTSLITLSTAISSIQATNGLVPTGAVMSFNRTICPTWWTEADGADGRPNLRGQFVRGWNSTASGLDPSRAFWSAQNATRVISSYWGDGGWIGAVPDIMHRAAADADSSGRVWNGTNNAGGVAYPTWPGIVAGQSAHVDGMRVRPANVALLYCVKD